MNVLFNNNKTFADWRYNMSTFINNAFRKQYGNGSIIHYCGSKAKANMLRFITNNKRRFSTNVIKLTERMINGK